MASVPATGGFFAIKNAAGSMIRQIIHHRLFPLGQIHQIRNERAQNQQGREERQHGSDHKAVFHEPHAPGHGADGREGEEASGQQRDGDGDARVIKPFQHQHPGALDIRHADGLHHGELFFPGHDAG